MERTRMRRLLVAVATIVTVFAICIPSTAFATVRYVEGGTWTYWVTTSGGAKSCGSYYYHPTRYHGSTAIVYPNYSRIDVAPAQTSRAYTVGWSISTALAYYRVN